jgi:hypothetical protein
VHPPVSIDSEERRERIAKMLAWKAPVNAEVTVNE